MFLQIFRIVVHLKFMFIKLPYILIKSKDFNGSTLKCIPIRTNAIHSESGY